MLNKSILINILKRENDKTLPILSFKLTIHRFDILPFHLNKV